MRHRIPSHLIASHRVSSHRIPPRPRTHAQIDLPTKYYASRRLTPYQTTDHARTHAECNFVTSTEGSTYQSAVLDKYVYKPRTDDEYYEALARGGQKSEVRACAVDVGEPITNQHTILDISPTPNELHHHRYSRRPTVPN